MNEKDCRALAIQAVVDYFNSQADSTDKNGKINAENVFIVWSVKVLQNNKMLLSTTVPDGMYYEFTWNGDKNEGYLDCYKKWKNILVCVNDGESEAADGASATYNSKED